MSITVRLLARFLARACLLASLALVSGPAQASDQFIVNVAFGQVDADFVADNRIQRGALLRIDFAIGNACNDFRVESVGFETNLPDGLAFVQFANVTPQDECGGTSSSVSAFLLTSISAAG